MKKRIIRVIFLLFMVFYFNPQVNAGSLSIWANATTTTPGGTIKVTVKADGLAGKFSISSSNGSVLSGGNSGIWIENNSQTFNFTAKSIGTATITVVPNNVGDLNNNSKYTASKSITINVVKPREKSTNNNLKSLSVDGYDISPKFDKDTLEYTVNLESNVEKIKINATKENGYASVSGTGEKEVVEGDNKFEITVTSETGKKKVYVLNAIVKDSNPIIRKVDGKEYSVVKRESALTEPENFTKTTVTIDEVEIPAFYNESTKTTLIGMKDENGVIYLFKYDNDNLTKYETLTSSSLTIIFEEPQEIDNLTKTIITIDDKEYTAYKYKDSKDYVLIYGTELNTNTKNWYLYNIKENSIQTFIGDNTDESQEIFDNNINEYKIVILSLIGLSLLLLIIVIIQISSKNKMKKKFKNKLQLMKEIETNLKNQLEEKKETNNKKIKNTKSK